MSQFKTPLRYPGGKQKLTPFINEILIENEISEHYVEPYAGGAGVGIELLLTRQIQQIHLNDSHFGIYAFWHSVIKRTDDLCELIASSSLTVDEWKLRREIVKKGNRRNILELGFSIFYLNRCNRSGVLSGGLIGGLSQEGEYKMDARFPRNELIQRIEAISLFKDRISLTNLDAEDYINSYVSSLPKNSMVYLDPPYFQKGGDLYLNAYKKDDHARLATKIQKKIKHKWVLSYDNVPDILHLYNSRRQFTYDLQYSAAKSYKGKEVFIFCDCLRLPSNSSLQNINSGLESLIDT